LRRPCGREVFKPREQCGFRSIYPLLNDRALNPILGTGAPCRGPCEMARKPREPKDVIEPAFDAVEHAAENNASLVAPLPPKPVEGPIDRDEIRRSLIARFPKTLAYLAK
jgi:hypothetical protein